VKIIAVKYATSAVTKGKPEKTVQAGWDWNPKICDSGAVL